MEKKISINMTDDEVTSIEVDGVQYVNPDEIPDPEDRERVIAMLFMPQDDAFNADFDEEAFEKKFA